ncbi:Protein kinase superfamily protein [Striga hermonthica]|uniref:Protein kinase superfamily protein n=1 Tax=Striga hermonthica TaxID=68872 RepID=A0A9N7MJD5_STRHE|nr:Protein kinase superfamily protein [Striga hermonthica]
MEVSTHTRSTPSLRHIHGLDYVHCALKPDNVLLVADDVDEDLFTAKVSDFGLSEERGTVPHPSSTAAYLSPEATLFGRREEPSDHVVDWIRGLLLGEESYERVYKATLINSTSLIAIAVKTSLSETLGKEFEILVRLYECLHVIRCLGYHTTQVMRSGWLLTMLNVKRGDLRCVR